MKQIKKRDGRTVDFNVTKIEAAIKAACEASSTEITEDNLKLLSQKIAEACQDGITVESIQDIVENELMAAEMFEAAKSYIKYREKRTAVRESKTALLVSLDDMFEEKVTAGSSHKENANINTKSASGKFYRFGSEASKEYGKAYLMPEEFVENFGYIYYHDRDYYGLSLNCMQHDLLKMFKKGFTTGNAYISEPQSIYSAMALTCVILQSGQNDLFGGESVPAWDFYMEPYVNKSFGKFFKKHLLRLGIPQAKVEALLKDYGYQEHTPVFEDDSIYKAYSWAKKDTEEESYQGAQAMVYNFNSMACRSGGQVVFSSLNLGTCTKPGGRLAIKAVLKALDDGIGKGVTSLFPIVIFKLKDGISYKAGDTNYDLRLEAERVCAKRMFPNFSNLDAPYNLKFYKEGHPETEVAYMGCRTRVIANVNGPEIVTDRGNLSFTTLNLPRFAIEAKKEALDGDPELALGIFYNKLNKYLDMAKRQLEHRYEIQCSKKVYNFPYVMMQGAYMGSEYLLPEDSIRKAIENGTLSFGFVGLSEALKAMFGHDHTEGEEYQKIGIDIVKYMYDYCTELTKETHLNWSLIATPAESVAGTLLRMDKKLYGEIEGVTDKEYYTNSFHVPVSKKMRASEKVRIEAPYHQYCTAGAISYIELEGNPTQNIDALHTLVNVMHDSGMGYFSFNSNMDTHTGCGYTGIIGDTCPFCGQKETVSNPIIRPRRVTGYLSYENRFNHSKEAELNDRVKHV